jgi:hypothetical protein
MQLLQFKADYYAPLNCWDIWIESGRVAPELVHTRNHEGVCVAEVDPSAINETIFLVRENDYALQYKCRMYKNFVWNLMSLVG